MDQELFQKLVGDVRRYRVELITDFIQDLDEIYTLVADIQSDDRDVDDVLQDIEVYIRKHNELIEDLSRNRKVRTITY
ncbi:MAG: hypothetical protein WCX73_05735 [Candidatus Pacearchaeota archaeon]